MQNLTHINSQGRARMVDVTDKDETLRVAKASCAVFMKSETLKRIKDGDIKKGDVLAVAQVAGIQAAKNTYTLIPMAHQILLRSVDIEFEFGEDKLYIHSIVKCKDVTGVEMEALVSVNIAALTIYDMCKAIDRSMEITNVHLDEKRGGASGTFRRV